MTSPTAEQMTELQKAMEEIPKRDPTPENFAAWEEVKEEFFEKSRRYDFAAGHCQRVNVMQLNLRDIFWLMIVAGLLFWMVTEYRSHKAAIRQHEQDYRAIQITFTMRQEKWIENAQKNDAAIQQLQKQVEALAAIGEQ